MNFNLPESVTMCSARTGLFNMKSKECSQQEFVDLALGRWNTFPGNYLVLSNDAHEEHAEMLYREVYVPFQSLLKQGVTAQELGGITALLAKGDLDSARQALQINSGNHHG